MTPGPRVFYDHTSYSSTEVVWSAPAASLGISIPTQTTLPGLVGELLASQLENLIGQTIAIGLNVNNNHDDKALLPPRYPDFEHKCE